MGLVPWVIWKALEMYPEFNRYSGVKYWPLKVFIHLILRTGADQHKKHLRNGGMKKTRRQGKKAEEGVAGEGAATGAEPVVSVEQLAQAPAIEQSFTIEDPFGAEPPFDAKPPFDPNHPFNIEPEFGVEPPLDVDASMAVGDNAVDAVVGELSRMSMDPGMPYDATQDQEDTDKFDMSQTVLRWALVPGPVPKRASTPLRMARDSLANTPPTSTHASTPWPAASADQAGGSASALTHTSVSAPTQVFPAPAAPGRAVVLPSLGVPSTTPTPPPALSLALATEPTPMPTSTPPAVAPTPRPTTSPTDNEDFAYSDLAMVFTPSVIADLERLAALPENMRTQVPLKYQGLLKTLPLAFSPNPATSPGHVPVSTLTAGPALGPGPGSVPAPALALAAGSAPEPVPHSQPQPKPQALPQPMPVDDDNESVLSDAPSTSESNPPVDTKQPSIAGAATNAQTTAKTKNNTSSKANVTGGRAKCGGGTSEGSAVVEHVGTSGGQGKGKAKAKGTAAEAIVPCRTTRVVPNKAMKKA
ncbi:hypothetical protein FRC06_004210 [Ceratobasidium sp. 370]|nr:hypothetical protein FRC06_004210 [Ceratobasidium sp. 370]